MFLIRAFSTEFFAVFARAFSIDSPLTVAFRVPLHHPRNDRRLLSEQKHDDVNGELPVYR